MGIARCENPCVGTDSPVIDNNIGFCDFAPVPSPSRRRTNSQQQRERLIRAAVRVVSQHGFAGASAQRITTACGLSQGSLYTYFDSLQELLDELLPVEGLKMLAALRKAAEHGQGYFDVERKTFDELINYLRRRPVIVRLATEGEFATPTGYRQHFDNIVVRYLRAMKRGQASGELRQFDDRSLDVTARVLSYVRGGVIRGFCPPDARRLLQPRSVPDWLGSAFERFLRHGIGSASPVPQRIHSVTPDEEEPQLHGAAATRSRILAVAMELIGLHGNAGTTVADICEQANVGIGTLYGHFPARSDLLPHALSQARELLLKVIDTSTQGRSSYLDYEAGAFDGYFDFVESHPWYPRLETEAAVNAPAAFLVHIHAMSAHTMQAITTLRAEPEFAAFAESEWSMISHISVAARHFLAIDAPRNHGTSIRPDDSIRKTWLEVLARGLQAHAS